MPDINFPYDIPLINQCSSDDYVFIHRPGGEQADIKKARIRELPIMRSVRHDNSLLGKGTADSPLKTHSIFDTFDFCWELESDAGNLRVFLSGDDRSVNGYFLMYLVRAINCGNSKRALDDFQWTTTAGKYQPASVTGDYDHYISEPKVIRLFSSRLPTSYRPKQRIIGIPNLGWMMKAITVGSTQTLGKTVRAGDGGYDECDNTNFCLYIEITPEGYVFLHTWMAHIPPGVYVTIPYISINFQDNPYPVGDDLEGPCLANPYDPKSYKKNESSKDSK